PPRRRDVEGDGGRWALRRRPRHHHVQLRRQPGRRSRRQSLRPHLPATLKRRRRLQKSRCEAARADGCGWSGPLNFRIDLDDVALRIAEEERPVPPAGQILWRAENLHPAGDQLLVALFHGRWWHAERELDAR